MEQGRPPIGNDGLRAELHHQNQNPHGPFEELTRAC
ncbi:HNH/ENDO VII family nuclease [Planctomyces sp. SH-PL62]